MSQASPKKDMKKKVRQQAQKRTYKQDSGKPKAQKRKQGKRQVYRQKPKLEIAQSLSLATTQGSIQISADWQSTALVELTYAQIAYAFTRNVTSNNGFNIQAWYDGLAYETDGLFNEMLGTSVLNNRKKIINDLIYALKPKTVPWRNGGSLSYSWNDPQLAGLGSLVLPWGTVQMVIPTDSGVYNTVCPPYTPTADQAQYPDYLGTFMALDKFKEPWLKTVSTDHPSTLLKDVSAFARTYAYNENTNMVGSIWNDSENEVVIKNPTVARFCPYTANTRYPSYGGITVTSGSTTTCLSPLLMCEHDWFNKVPVQYYFVDFYDLVNRIIYWWVELDVMAVGNDGTRAGTFPFTYQDFTVMMRQVLMCMFKEQWFGMLMSPNTYNNTANNFLPFFVAGNCFGSRQFETAQFPTLWLENIAALQSEVVNFNPRGGSKYNRQILQPVLGYYSADTPNGWTFSDGTPVFSSNVQNEIALWNGTIGNNAVNLNDSYYVAVLQQWNEAVTSMKGFSMPIDTCTSVSPVKIHLNRYQRLVGTIQPDKVKAVKIPFAEDFASTKYLSNSPYRKRSPSKKEVKVNLIPPATQAQLVYLAQYSANPVPSDIQNFLNVLCTPTGRLDDNANTPYTLDDFQVQQQLPHVYPISNPNLVAPTYLGQQQLMGQSMVVGLGRDTGNKASNIIDFLNAKVEAGILSQLLGSVVKSIVPGSDSIVDSVASVLPF